MPIYDFECEEHGVWETLAKYNEPKPCPVCGMPGVRMVSLPAKMSTLWNAGWNSGLSNNGFYSHSAGQRVSDKREEERIMRARGKINVKDLGGEAFEDSYIAGKQRERREHEALTATWKDNLAKFGGDKVRAMTETFPASKMLEQSSKESA